MDDRLHLAATLEEEADEDFAAASWLFDRTTERCAEKRELARRLREHVSQEAEIQALEREAEAELTRGRRRRRVA
jgi:hypothetical protein